MAELTKHAGPIHTWWHESVTQDRLSEMIHRRMSSLDNPGICLTCGNEAEGVEPDATEYECEACGEDTVFGPELVLIEMARFG